MKLRLLSATSAIYWCILSLSSCVGNNSRSNLTTYIPCDSYLPGPEVETTKELSVTASKLIDMGLVDIASIDPSIAVKIVYATADNFAGEVLYEDLNQAYMLPETATKLAAAQTALKKTHPEYSLIVYDAARPMSVQRKMRSVAVRDRKQYYVANPANGGGLHNYGAAVDVSVIDQSGVPLNMGSGYDFLDPVSNTDNEAGLVTAGIITDTELENRLLLRKVMTEAGFRTVTSEWWHFNLCSRKYAVENYKLIE